MSIGWSWSRWFVRDFGQASVSAISYIFFKYFFSVYFSRGFVALSCASMRTEMIFHYWQSFDSELSTFSGVAICSLLLFF